MTLDQATKASIDCTDSKLRHTIDVAKQFNEKLTEVDKRLRQAPHKHSKDLQIPNLILQLRLDQQSVIRHLVALDQHLCRALGIEKGVSAEHNLERMSHALGDLTLQQELAILGKLANEVSKIANLESSTLSEKQKHKKLLRRLYARLLKLGAEGIDAFKKLGKGDKSEARSRINIDKEKKRYAQGIHEALQHALESQHYFHLSLEQLTEALHQYEGIPRFGHLYDYLAGIKAPINTLFTVHEEGLRIILGFDSYLQQVHGLSLQHSQANAQYVALQQKNIMQLINKLQETQGLQQNALQNIQKENVQLQAMLDQVPKVGPAVTPEQQQEVSLKSKATYWCSPF